METKTKGATTVAEAGRKGGERCRDLAAKGQLTVRDAGRMGGQKGGQTTKTRYGSKFYAEIGSKGGQVVRDVYGPDFYKEIGKKGGAKVRELIAAGKKASGGER